MAKLSIDGREIEAPEGAPLVEVIKRSGIYVPNLCYIDGLPPYAGCRMCLVDIEGARGLQLSCTAKVAEGMIVRTATPDAREGRKAVLSIILANHSDRCLTCHRVVKCKPGDTCLRDNVVTHRCVTCSKNYRCELQTACELVEMAGYEPFEGEERSYYQTEQPPPDRANPFVEFDAQMCIICTRCVRACDEIRHTGAITLAGRGYETRIAFGADGPIHESNCDFCGACIDVCPVAALMEHPNKWSATQTERWVPTTCNFCSVGCSINLGVKKGRGVIVKPDTSANPVSRDQLCVRGRFHYDAIKPSQRLGQPLLRRDGRFQTVSWDEALDFTTASLIEIRDKHGPDAIGFLGSPLTSNEENYLLQKVARAVIGTNNVDSSTGPVTAAVAQSLRNAFVGEVLPADMTQLARSKTIVAIADDLESSHNVACLRIKDAVVRNGARLIVVSARWGELCDFAQAWLRPRPGEEAAIVDALAQALLTEDEVQQRLAEAGIQAVAATDVPELSQQLQQTFSQAVEILQAAAGDEAQTPISILYAIPHFGERVARATAAAVVNLAIACCGARAPSSLFVLPQEANVWGMRDMGVTPEYFPGYRPSQEGEGRFQVALAWGVPIPSTPGLGFSEMMEAAQAGKLRALIILGDNPLMMAPDRGYLKEALTNLEFLAVIDPLTTDTANLAHIVLPDVSIFGKEGTITNADRRVLRLHAATAPQGEARPAWQTLGQLGARLARRLDIGVRLNYVGPGEIMDEIAGIVPLYEDARYKELESGKQQPMGGVEIKGATLQSVRLFDAVPAEHFVLTTGRSLYTSYEGAALHSDDADKLHREEFLEINPADADALGLKDGDEVKLKNKSAELAVPCRITGAVQLKTLFIPLYYDGGAVSALFSRNEAVAQVQVMVPTSTRAGQSSS